MIKIKPGDPQPLDCPNCKSKEGYQYSDYMKTHYTDVYLPDGGKDGGFYSESQRTVNIGVTASCCLCLGRLPFKMNRE